ncbi:uncharacterized protein LOC111804479 [Cucurbita pepo subsp. pepo]|uniref:uncharacterized protein LOC111804479 n=1 Tax=Cucurbita pepo subsp. pepo TaxID=3664 RepID=UPI000C9D6FBB|nr:uncharacterized protein LOC111804479 [Cucurbita pepo subsp. pepo]
MWATAANQMQPLPDPTPATATEPSHSGQSIQTLVVVLAVIIILGVIARILARFCGGNHSGGGGADGENDIEGWVERTCRSCIDGGVATPPPEAAEEKK